MQRILFGDKECRVLADKIAIGEKFLNFSLTDENFKDKFFDSFEKRTVFSVFPAINTGVCEQQNKTLEELAKKFPNIDFYSVSLDLPPTLKTWCNFNKAVNIKVFSDYKSKEFGKKFGLLIEELQILNRAIFLVNKSGIVEYCEYKEQVGEAIDFLTLEKFLES